MNERDLLHLEEHDDHDDRHVQHTGGAPREAQAAPARRQLAAAAKLSAWQLRRKRRRGVVRWALWSADNTARITYSQSRPKDDIRGNYTPHYLPTDLDCSSHAIRAYQVADAPSPSIYGYSGYGATYDMESHGRQVADPVLADLKFYEGHVTIYVGTIGSLLADREWRQFRCVQAAGSVYAKTTRMCVSHGSNSGPVLRPLYYRNDFHPGFRRSIP